MKTGSSAVCSDVGCTALHT